jgi:hypothetical protein
MVTFVLCVRRLVVKQVEEKQSKELLSQALDLLNKLNWTHAAQYVFLIQRCGPVTFFARIRIRGFVPLTNASGFGSCKMATQNFVKVFLLLLFEVTFTSFFKDKKS